MILENIEDFTEDTIQHLIDTKVKESYTLDYKRQLLEWKKLVKAVSCFANSKGGILILGVETDNDDIPIKKTPIPFKPKLKEQISQSIRDNISPPVDNINIKIILSANKVDCFILIQVPQTKLVHSVVINKRPKYYKRSQFECRPVDYFEIKFDKSVRSKDISVIEEYKLITSYLEDSTIVDKKEIIISLSTGSKVDYTPLKVDYKESGQTTKWKDALEWWVDTKKPKLILAEPGQGKSTLVKKFFSYSKRKFTSKKSGKIPILGKLSHFKSFESGIDWLCDSTYNLLNKSLVQKKIEKGAIILFADGWDELAPKYRNQAERFLSEITKKKNDVTITSRFIEHEPSLRVIHSGKEQKLIIQTCELRPLDYHQIPEFIKNRNPDMSNTRLQSFQKSFLYSDLKAIPLWLDLLSTIPDFDPEKKLLEMDLLTHWVNQVKLRDDFVYKELDKVERLAYITIESTTRPKITKNYIKEKIELSDEAFDGLFTIGWLVPSGYEKVEPKYEFVHFRLHEFLASRYLSKNWKMIENSLFEREEGLLSQKNKEILIEHALLNLKYQNTPQHILVEKVYSIVGEPGWEIGEKIDYQKLRDPLLAGYLYQILELFDESHLWIEVLDNFFKDLFNVMNDEKKRNLILSYLRPQYLIRSLLCRVPYLVLFDDNYGKVVRASLRQFKLHTVIIDKLLNLLKDSQFIENSEYEKLFYDILEKRPSLGPWEEYVKEHITDMVRKKSRSIYLAFSMLPHKIKQRLALEWAYNTDPDIKIYPNSRGIYWMADLFDTQQIIDIYEYWIEDENVEIRENAFQHLIDNTEYLTSSFVQKLMMRVSDTDRVRLFDTILDNHSSYDPPSITVFFSILSEDQKKQCCSNIRFLKLLKLAEYSELADYFMKNAPLWLKIDLLVHFCNEDAGKRLIPSIKVSDTEEQIKKCIGRLSYLRNKEVQIAESVFSEFPHLLKLLLLGHEIYTRFLQKNPIVTTDELLIVLDDYIYFFHQIKDELTKNELISGIEDIFYQFLNQFDPPPVKLLEASLYSSFEQEWLSIPILFEWFDAIVQTDDTPLLERYSRFFRKNSDYIKENESFQQRIFHFLSDSQILGPRWFLLECALLIENFPKNEIRRYVLEALINSKDPMIRAIGLRIMAEDSGINLKRVMNKANASLRKGMIRPSIKERTTLDLDKKGIIGIIKVTEGEIKSPSFVNFGLMKDKYRSVIPEHKSLKYEIQMGILLFPSRTKSFLPFDAPHEEKTVNIFQNWLFTSLERKNKYFSDLGNISWINDGLIDQSDEIKIAVMYYIEDLIYQGTRCQDQDKILLLLADLQSSENEIISSFSLFLTLLLVPDEEKNKIITTIDPTLLNLQAIFWALGSFTSNELDKSVLLFVKKFQEEKLFNSIDIFNPWIIFYPNLFRHFWDVLLKLESATINKHLFNNSEPKLFYYILQIIILADQSLDLIFLTLSEIQSYEGVETWLKYLKSKIHFSRREITEFVSKLEDHDDVSLQLFGSHLKIGMKLDYNILNTLLSADTPSYTDLRISLMFYQQLDKIHLKKLYKIILSEGYDDLQFQAVEILRFFPINRDTIFFLKLTFNWMMTKFPNRVLPYPFQHFFSYVNKCEGVLLKKYFDEVVSELDSNIRYLVSYSTDREILYRLLNHYSALEPEKGAKSYRYIFALLFPKTWYTYPQFWSDVLKNS